MRSVPYHNAASPLPLDLDQTCVSQGILDMGLAFPRGVDRDGNVIGTL